MPLRLAVLLGALAFVSAADVDQKASVDQMTSAARAFLATLDAPGLEKARLPFDSDKRFEWYYTPVPRHGLTLKAMTPAQQKAALDLLRAGLSEKGFSKTQTIITLEPVLAEIEQNPVRRDPTLYYFSIFGDPAPNGAWGWRFEGHHISLHWTFVAGRSLASTPQFLGANPAQVRSGPKTGLRALAPEEDLGRAFLKSLKADQLREAVIAEKAPNDIATTNSRQAGILENRGLSWTRMSEPQRGMLLALIEEYAGVQRPAIAAERLKKVRDAGIEKVVFAWMGGPEPGQGHYYRVQGPTFVIEYDNTQNENNHIHSVWRDFNGDFGLDLLAQHYKTADHHQAGRSDAQYVTTSGKRFFAQSDAKENVTQLIALGDAQAGLWNVRDAIPIYDRAIALDPKNATAFQQRGHRYLSIREFQKARADLEKAAQMDPKLLSAWYYLGVLDYAEGKFDKAAADFEKNLALQDDDFTKAIGTVDWLYMSYRRGKQDDKAKQLLDRVTPDLKIEGSPRLYFNRTLFYKGLKNPDELLAAAATDIERTTLAYGIGNYYLAAGDKQKAREYMEKAVGTSAWVGLAFIAAEKDLQQLR
jgi:tetratricopeptide (TPR) repeat protein